MPVVDLGRQPAKATVGEPFPVRATVFREGHDKLGAEVVLTGPDGRRRPPVRMAKHPEVPDRYDAWVTPDAGGAWTFEVQAWSDPLGTWQHDAGLKIPAGVDVELMFTEARLLLERVGPELSPDDTHAAAVLRDAAHAAADTERPVGARLAALQSPELTALLLAHPLRELVTVEGPYPAYADRERALFGSWYEFFPRSEGATKDPATGKVDERQLPDRRQAPRRRGRDGLRRHLPAPDPPDRRGQPQGPEQHPDPRPRRHRLAVGDRVQGRRPRRDPPRPRHVRGLRRVRRARRRARARGRPRPGPPGGARPPLGDDAPRVVHHPRRRHDRLRREPAEEVPGHLPGQLRQRPDRHLPRGAPRRPALDVPRRADLPGRQPAHQAGGVLGVAAQGDPPDRPRRAVPRPRRSPGRR